MTTISNISRHFLLNGLKSKHNSYISINKANLKWRHYDESLDSQIDFQLMQWQW